MRRGGGNAAQPPGGSPGAPRRDLGREDLTAADERRIRNLAREREKRRARGRKIRVGIFLLCLFAGLGLWVSDQAVRQNARAANQSLRAFLGPGGGAPGAEAPPEGAGEAEAAERRDAASPAAAGAGLAAIRQDNSDLVGWIRVHCLYRIDLPVFKRDNEYYLNHDASGGRNEEGSVFVDEGSTLSPRDMNCIVYAHNCASGEMFGTLYQMANPVYLSQDPLVTFGLLDANGVYAEEEYVPFAVLRTTVGYREDEFDFLVRNFDDEEGFRFFYERAAARSLIPDRVGCERGDTLLTLVTCSDRAGESRLVVLLRRLRQGEDAAQMKQRFSQAG